MHKHDWLAGPAPIRRQIDSIYVDRCHCYPCLSPD
jgi:hypothetical protein